MFLSEKRDDLFHTAAKQKEDSTGFLQIVVLSESLYGENVQLNSLTA